MTDYNIFEGMTYRFVLKRFKYNFKLNVRFFFVYFES